MLQLPEVATALASPPKATPWSLLFGKPFPHEPTRLPDLGTDPSLQRQKDFDNELEKQDDRTFTAAFMGHLAAIRGEKKPANQAHMLQSLIKRCRAMAPPLQGMAQQILNGVADLVYAEQVSNDFALHALTRELRTFVTLCTNHYQQPIARADLERLRRVEEAVQKAFKGKLSRVRPESKTAGLGKLLGEAHIETSYSIPLESGTLEVSVSTEDDSGNVLHQAIYRHRNTGVDVISQGFTDILPSDCEMSSARFNRAKEDLQAGRPFDPIEVATTNDGDLVVRTGQERFAAALLVTGEVALLIDPRAEDDTFALAQRTWSGLQFGS